LFPALFKADKSEAKLRQKALLAVTKEAQPKKASESIKFQAWWENKHRYKSMRMC